MAEDSKPFAPPLLILGIGILAVSTASIFIRYAQQEVPSLVIAAYRLSLASLVLAPAAILRHRREIASLQRRDIALALFSGVFLALHFATWITSLEYTTVASSVVLVTTTPLWVAMFAPLLLRERLTKAVLAGMSLALVGGILVGISDACNWSPGGIVCPNSGDILRGRAVWGNLLAVSGALMAAAYVMIGRVLRSKLTLIAYIFLVYGVAAVVLIIIMLASRLPVTGYSPQAYLWLVLLALLPQLLGHSSFNWALRYLSAAYVSITLLGEPIGTIILAYFLLQERPSLMKLFGAILILFGIYTASRSESTTSE